MFTLIKVALAFFVGYMVYIVSGPVIKMLRYDNSTWDTMPTWMQAWGDQMYGIWILFAVLIAATIIVFGIAESNRNRNLEA